MKKTVWTTDFDHRHFANPPAIQKTYPKSCMYIGDDNRTAVPRPSSTSRYSSAPCRKSTTRTYLLLMDHLVHAEGPHHSWNARAHEQHQQAERHDTPIAIPPLTSRKRYTTRPYTYMYYMMTPPAHATQAPSHLNLFH